MKSIENAKKKASRRYGANLWGDPKSPFNKREYAPGQHGQRRKKMTDYGEQLYAKQKMKTYYGNVSEKQFSKYYAEAIRRTGDAAENLVGLLESRLDNLVYKAKFASTVFADCRAIGCKLSRRMLVARYCKDNAIIPQHTITNMRILRIVLLNILPLRLRLNLRCWKLVLFPITIFSLLLYFIF